MNATLLRSAGLIALAVGFAGCSSSSRMPPALYPAPTPPVQQSTLPPPQGTLPQDTNVADGQTPPEETQVATIPPAPPPPPSAPLQQTDVLGQWTIASATAACTANVTLTGWSGGYRASTRNCSDPGIAQLGAWNIENNQVVLKDTTGAPLAVLNRTGATRFDGQFVAGGPISLVR